MLFNLLRGILKILGKEVEDIGEVDGIRKVGEKSYWGLIAVSQGMWSLLGLEKIFQKIEGRLKGRVLDFFSSNSVIDI